MVDRPLASSAKTHVQESFQMALKWSGVVERAALSPLHSIKKRTLVGSKRRSLAAKG